MIFNKKNIYFLDEFDSGRHEDFKNSYENYIFLYKNLGYANRIVNLVPLDVWSVPFKVNALGNNIAFQKTFSLLDERFCFKDLFLKAHQAARLGTFIVLFPRLLEHNPDLSLPPRGKVVLNGVDILSELDVGYELDDGGVISEYKLFKTNTSVHPSRMIHVNYPGLNKPYKGLPLLQPILRNLIGIQKTQNSATNLFGLNARGGIHVDKKLGEEIADLSQEERVAIRQQYEKNLKKYIDGINRVLMSSGGATVTTLNHTQHNPDILIAEHINEICAAIGIPKNILLGNETGVLASEKDNKIFEKNVNNERVNFCERVLMRPFFRWLISHGILPNELFEIQWQQRREVEAAQAAEIAQKKSSMILQAVGMLERYADSSNLPLDALLDIGKLAILFKTACGLEVGEQELQGLTENILKIDNRGDFEADAEASGEENING